MTRKLKAVVFPRPNEVEFQEFDLPPCGAEDVVVKTHYSMVSSGTELRMWSGKAQFPMIPGYAAVGEIIEVGAKVVGYRRGDLISGRSCPRFVPGINAPCGGHMSFQVYPATGEDRPVLLPAGAQPLDYVITEIASICQRGVAAAAPQPAETAVVLGQGVIGAFSAAWLHAAGCHVIVADLEEGRLERTRKWSQGQVATVRISAEGAAERILAMLNGGADIVVESSGSIPGVKMALSLVRGKPRNQGGSAYYRGEPIATFAGSWPRLVMQASYTELVSLAPHGFYPGEGLTILCPADRSLEDRQKTVKAIQKGVLRAADFLDQVVPSTAAPAIYSSLRDDKGRCFSAVFDWTQG